MHSITLNQNWKIVRVTLDPPQKGPSRKGNEPIIPILKCCCAVYYYEGTKVLSMLNAEVWADFL